MDQAISYRKRYPTVYSKNQTYSQSITLWWTTGPDGELQYASCFWSN